MTRAPARGRLRRLRRAELPEDTIELSRYLLGKIVVHDLPHGRISGRIVETEAYPVGDAAGHAYRGQTMRNSSLFLRRGHAYVYFIYGTSYLLNVSSEASGIGGGVLLRALEPLEGLDLMRELRGTQKLRDLSRGPGRLSQALGIDLRQDGLDMCAPGSLWLAEAVRPAGTIATSIRIGISKAADQVLRFYEVGNPHVSGTQRLNTPGG